MMALKGWYISKFPGKTHYLDIKRPLKNWRLPTQLIIFPDFWAKILEIARPVNYSYFTSLVVCKENSVRNEHIYNKLMMYESTCCANRIALSFTGVLHDRVLLKTTLPDFSDVVQVKKKIKISSSHVVAFPISNISYCQTWQNWIA